MWVRNTSAYPDDEVRRLVKSATQRIDMRRVCVNVKGGERWRGNAYDHVPFVSNAPPSAEYLVTLRLPMPWRLMKVGEAYRGEHVTEKVAQAIEHAATLRTTPSDGLWPEARVLRCWHEGLVWIAAHEAKHIEQFREGLPRSERRCERFAASVSGSHDHHRPEGHAHA